MSDPQDALAAAPKPHGHTKRYDGSICVIRRAKVAKRCTYEIGYDECGRLIAAGDLYADWTGFPWGDMDRDGFDHMPVCDLHPQHWGL